MGAHRRNLVVVLASVFFLELGERLGERFLPIYLMATGAGALIVGLSNAVDNLLGALYAFPGGILSDRIGYKKTLILFDIVAMVGYAIVIVFPHWIAVFIGALMFTSWGAVSVPPILSAISKNLPPNKRVLGVSLHSLIRRFPMAVGPVLAGLLIARFGERDGIRLSFVFSFFITFAFALIQQFLIVESKAVQSTLPASNPLRFFDRMKPQLKRLLISDILIRFCEQIPYAFVVVWCLKNLGVSAVDFGLLTSIEMATAILVYIPVAILVEKAGKKKPFIAVTFAFFSLFPIVIWFSNGFWTLAFAFFVRGLKEFGEPTRKSLILDFAQGPEQGTLFGAYYMIRDTVVSLGAFLGGVLWVISPELNFLLAFLFGFAGFLYFLFYCQE